MNFGLYPMLHLVRRGLGKAPFRVRTVFGSLHGIGSHPDDVAHMTRTGDRPFHIVFDAKGNDAPAQPSRPPAVQYMRVAPPPSTASTAPFT